MIGTLEQLTLCTYSTGRDMVREVLSDWIAFVGGRPHRVIVAVSPAGAIPPVYEELRQEKQIDTLISLEAQARSVYEINAQAVRLTIEAAPTEWVLLVKLDTLPYRRGNESWLAEVIEIIKREGLFGLTGSFLVKDPQPLFAGYSMTGKFSENFALFRRSDWLNVVRSFPGPLPDDPRFEGKRLRYANEVAIESHLENTQRRMLVKHESIDWSVFHVNVWGETLRQVRADYLSRKEIHRFLNRGKPQRRTLRHPWNRFYGYPKPPLLKRLRIVLGRWRRQIGGDKER